MIRIVACILLAVSLTAYAGETKTVSDEDKQYTIELPSDWVHSVQNNRFVSVMACQANDTAKMNERLNVVVSKSGGRLKSAYKDLIDEFENFDEFEALQEGEGQLADQPCRWFVYTMAGGEPGKKMKGKQYVLIKDRRLFNIGYLAPEERFDDAQREFEQMVATFAPR
ncbi:MAG: hypothetical protein GF331_18205 [Chitinivibrionales bacterium]|nr:hypothetical protein [Chitinivibrionales bacterium]